MTDAPQGPDVPRWELLRREQGDPRPPDCRTPEDPARCRCGAGNRITELCEIIDSSARLVDAQLARPARWRGQTRREALGHCAGREAIRYRDAFDWIVGTGEPITEEYVIEIHQRAVGWRHYRTCHLWVDCGYRHPEPGEIPRLVRLAFARLDDTGSSWPAPARALGLHLDLLTAHPFTDGNGRTSRLAATGVLARRGYRSTLLTAVEQFHRAAPARYLEALDQYRFARACRSRTIEQLLVAMAASSAAAAWARAHGLSLAQAAAIESGTSSPCAPPISLPPSAWRFLLAQLRRIDAEEHEDGAAGAAFLAGASPRPTITGA